MYSTTTGSGWSVLRVEKDAADVQTQLTQGEIILPSNTTIGYLGFDNETGKAKLTFGYPYVEHLDATYASSPSQRRLRRLSSLKPAKRRR